MYNKIKKSRYVLPINAALEILEKNEIKGGITREEREELDERGEKVWTTNLSAVKGRQERGQNPINGFEIVLFHPFPSLLRSAAICFLLSTSERRILRVVRVCLYCVTRIQ